MKIRFNRYVWLVIVIVSVAGCRSVSEVAMQDGSQQASRTPIIEYTEEELAEARSLYIRGITAFELQDYNEAIDLLMMAYIKLPDHAGVNYAMADAYMAIGDFTNAAYYGSQAVEIDPENRIYHIRLAEIYYRDGQLSRTVEVLEKARIRFPRDPEILFFLASTYTDTGRYSESNEVYGFLLQQQGPDMQLHFQRFRNFNMLDEPEKALLEIEKIYEIEPENPAVLQTLGSLYAEMEQYEKAIRLFQDALRDRPDQPDLKMSLTDLYIRQGDWSNAGALMKEVMESDQVDFRVKAELVQFLMARFVRDPDNRKLRSIAADMIEYFSDEYPEDAAAQALAADFFLSIEDFEMAQIKLLDTVRLMPENEPAWRQLVQLLYMQSAFDQLLEIKDEAEKNVPEDVFIRFFIGSAHYITGDPHSAIQWLELASEAPARPDFKSIVYGSLGDVYYTADRVDDAWQAYERSLEFNPDNATALNNYAYYLSTKNLRLEDAYEMSKKSLEFEPNNPSFLDTLGWIYFKKGNYDKAYEYITASVDNGSQSATVYEHLGDVYQKLGNKEMAREWWGKAFDTDPERLYLLDRLK